MNRERLRAGLSPNGKVVHLADARGRPVCRSGVEATCFVHARITCKSCRSRRPAKARRVDCRPHVVGVDWSPLYAALSRAIDGAIARGDIVNPKEPRVKVKFWPVLA